MNALPLLLPFALLLPGCAAWTPTAERALLVRGHAVTGAAMDWALDWCDAGVPKPFAQVFADCPQSGGELHRAALSGRLLGDPRGRLRIRMAVALPGHAYLRDFWIWDDFLLVPATPALQAATGLRWIAARVGHPDQGPSCIRNADWLHFTGGEADCPDKEFHRRGSCVPFAEFLAHYGRQ